MGEQQTSIPDERYQAEESPDTTALRRHMVQHFDSFINRYENHDGTIGHLTERQTETLMHTRQFLAEDRTRGYLKLPCGYGKSAMAIYIANAIGAGTPGPDGTRMQALLCTSRNSVIKQMMECNTQYDNDEVAGDFEYFAPNLRPTAYNQYGRDLTGDVVLMPYPSLNVLAAAKDRPFFSLWLLDESQNVSKARQAVIDARAVGSVVIGLSATPGKSEQFLQQKIDEVSMLDGIVRYRFLAGVEMSGVPTNHAFVRRKRPRNELAVADTEPLSYSQLRNELIVDQIYDNVLKFGKGIVKCHRRLRNRSHARDIARLASKAPPTIWANGIERPIRIECVGAENKRSEQFISEFLYGDSIDVLTYVEVLGQGVNLQANWGLWTPPTRSLSALEQFVGRGLRKDPQLNNKLFRMLQLVDVQLAHDDDNVFAWQIFNAPRNSRLVRVTKNEGRVVYGGTPSKDRQDPADIIRILADDLDTTKIAFTSERPLADMPHITLDDLEAITDIDRTRIGKILYNGGFAARAILDGEYATIAYDADALPFIIDSVATKEDISLDDLADAMKMAKGGLKLAMQDRGIAPTLLYSRGDTPHESCQVRLFLRPKDRAKLLAGSNEGAISSHEMTLQDVRRIIGGNKNVVALAEYFRQRNFTVVHRKTREHYIDTDLTVLRAEVEPWIEAYLNAKPLPKHGFKALKSYSWRRLPEGKVELADTLATLRLLGIQPRLFRTANGSRHEYVSEAHHTAILEKLPHIVANRNAIQTAQQQSRVAKNISDRLGIPREMVLRYAKQEGVQLDKAKNFTDIADFLELLTTVTQDLRIVAGEQHLMEVITGKPRTVPVAPPRQQPKKTAPTKTDVVTIEHANRRLPQKLAQSIRDKGIPLALCRQLIAKHAALSTTDLEDEATHAFVEDALSNLLRQIPGWRSIGRGWESAQTIAQELGVSEHELLHVWIKKGISKAHVTYVEVPGIRGVMGFCSPEFANFVRTRK